MFNGIIFYKGYVKKINKLKQGWSIQIKSGMSLNKSDLGSSIACNGVCLTLEKTNKNLLTFFLSKETIQRTSFKFIKLNEEINLEKSLKYGQPISGHFTQGHVDCTAKITKISKIGKSWTINFNLIKHQSTFVIYKSSITINGVSLTISKVFKKGFQVSVIPHTLKLTNLIKLKKANIVNVEFDMFAKYYKKIL